MSKEVVKIGRYIEFEHEDGVCENMLLLTEKETNAIEKQLKKSYEYEQEITQLTNNWNKLEEWLKSYISLIENPDTLEEQTLEDLKEVLDKMKEIKEGNNVFSRNKNWQF